MSEKVLKISKHIHLYELDKCYYMKLFQFLIGFIYVLLHLTIYFIHGNLIGYVHILHLCMGLVKQTNRYSQPKVYAQMGYE